MYRLLGGLKFSLWTPAALPNEEKIVKMIDGIVEQLKTEQIDDEAKKECQLMVMPAP